MPVGRGKKRKATKNKSNSSKVIKCEESESQDLADETRTPNTGLEENVNTEESIKQTSDNDEGDVNVCSHGGDAKSETVPGVTVVDDTKKPDDDDVEKSSKKDQKSPDCDDRMVTFQQDDFTKETEVNQECDITKANENDTPSETSKPLSKDLIDKTSDTDCNKVVLEDTLNEGVVKHDSLPFNGGQFSVIHTKESPFSMSQPVVSNRRSIELAGKCNKFRPPPRKNDQVETMSDFEPLKQHLDLENQSTYLQKLKRIDESENRLIHYNEQYYRKLNDVQARNNVNNDMHYQKLTENASLDQVNTFRENIPTLSEVIIDNKMHDNIMTSQSQLSFNRKSVETSPILKDCSTDNLLTKDSKPSPPNKCLMSTQGFAATDGFISCNEDDDDDEHFRTPTQSPQPQEETNQVNEEKFDDNNPNNADLDQVNVARYEDSNPNNVDLNQVNVARYDDSNPNNVDLDQVNVARYDDSNPNNVDLDQVNVARYDDSNPNNVDLNQVNAVRYNDSNTNSVDLNQTHAEQAAQDTFDLSSSEIVAESPEKICPPPILRGISKLYTNTGNEDLDTGMNKIDLEECQKTDENNLNSEDRNFALSVVTKETDRSDATDMEMIRNANDCKDSESRYDNVTGSGRNEDYKYEVNVRNGQQTTNNGKTLLTKDIPDTENSFDKQMQNGDNSSANIAGISTEQNGDNSSANIAEISIEQNGDNSSANIAEISTDHQTISICGNDHQAIFQTTSQKERQRNNSQNQETDEYSNNLTSGDIDNSMIPHSPLFLTGCNITSVTPHGRENSHIGIENSLTIESQLLGNETIGKDSSLEGNYKNQGIFTNIDTLISKGSPTDKGRPTCNKYDTVSYPNTGALNISYSPIINTRGQDVCEKSNKADKKIYEENSVPISNNVAGENLTTNIDCCRKYNSESDVNHDNLSKAIDMQQSLGSLLGDLGSTQACPADMMDFCDFDTQDFTAGNEELLADLDQDSLTPVNDKTVDIDEGIEKFESDFEKNQKMMADQIQKKKSEGANLVNSIMADLVSMNRQLLRMKREMDVVSKNLGKVSMAQSCKGRYG